MTRIVVKSRLGMMLGDNRPEVPYSVISITDPGESELACDAGWRFIQRLAFYDFDPISFPEWCAGKATYLTDDGTRADFLGASMQARHAEAMIWFASERLDAGDVLVIHCEQGVSRSPSAACAIADVLGIPRSEIDFGLDGGAGQPLNRHVYETIVGVGKEST